MGRRTIPGVGNRGFAPDAGQAAARTRLECPTCLRLIRPCNMARHRAACDREAQIVTEIANSPWPAPTTSTGAEGTDGA